MFKTVDAGCCRRNRLSYLRVKLAQVSNQSLVGNGTAGVKLEEGGRRKVLHGLYAQDLARCYNGDYKAT